MRKNRQKYVNINETLSLYDQLVDLYVKYRRSFFIVINNRQLIYLKNFVIESTAFLPANTKMIIRIHCVLQHIQELPKCKTCGKPIELKLNKYKRFNKYCNASCRQQDSSVRLKQNAKKLDLYGSVNNSEKMLQTKEIRYGTRGYNNSDLANKTKFEIYGKDMYDHEKYCATSNKKYGVDNYMQSESGKKYYKSRIEEKYGPGIMNVFQLPEIRQKGSKTKKEKYGDENYNNLEQAKQTCLKLYGVEHAMQYPEFQKHKSLYYYDNDNFDSKPELAYYIWLTDHLVKFEYHNEKYFEYWFNGKQHRYFPDFYLTDENIFVEIKGDHFFDNTGKMINPYRNQEWSDAEYLEECAKFEAKHQCMIENGVKILCSVEYNIYLDYIKEKYGKDYLDQFRKITNGN